MEEKGVQKKKGNRRNSCWKGGPLTGEGHVVNGKKQISSRPKMGQWVILGRGNTMS